MGRLDRNKLFALVGALEEDLRFLIEAYLTATRYEEQVLGPAYAKASDRYQADGDGSIAGTTILDYLDLGDEIEILNRWREYLPASTQDALVQVASELSGLVPIRNRVHHRRPLLPDDLERAEIVLERLVAAGFEGSTLAEALRHHREGSAWAPPTPNVVERSRTLNNLPLGDYDETGLIGRRRELDRLVKKLAELSSSRSPVLTVVGPGGIGKTALALQALHDLVNDDACPYDLVSWVSLKSEQLTARGVERIRDAVLTVEQAVPAMVEALDPSFSGSATQLADSLDGLTALIVIDNLETVSGREVVELVDTLPDSVSYLFTSREGLGEIERRFPLGQLEERYGVDLLRRLARSRGLESFARMDQGAASDLVRRLGTSPLGLKWFMSGVELGKEPEELVRNREDLVRFCVENVFDSLDENSKAIATVLDVLSRPATAQEISLYLPDLGPDQLRSSIQALDRRMLVRRDLVAGSISETFEATEPLVDYLRFAEVVDASEVRRVREADDAYRLAEERHRRDALSDPLRPNIVQGGQEHRASVLLLRNALSESKRGEVDRALDHIAEAEALDSEFWEIHRVRAFILSSSTGAVEEATAAYKRAVELAPTEQAAAAVKYFFAGHLSRRARNSEKAAELAREAHDVLRSERTAIELGRALTYLGEFERAETILGEAVNAEDARTRLIAVTQLVDCMRRRAESEAASDRRPDVAVATLADALEIAGSALREGLIDRTLSEKVLNLASDLLRYARSCQDPVGLTDEIAKAVESVLGLGAQGARFESFGYTTRHAYSLALNCPDVLVAVPDLSILSAELGGQLTHADPSVYENQLVLGKVKAWKPERHFGFVTTLDREDDFYFNLDGLSSPADEIRLRRGTTVLFKRVAAPDGRPQAQEVRVEDAGSDALADRHLLVDRLHASGNCLFAIDSDSGATVFVGRHAMSDLAQWAEVRVGSELVARVEIDADGRFRAPANSVSFAK